ncbi:MAG TPA: hypothetical protein VEQ65_01570 [Opitutus sp.]|nr:hypothetical protein [Opitutus sp.]
MKMKYTPLRSATCLAAASLALVLSACSKSHDASSDTAAAGASASSNATMSASTAGATASWDQLQTYSYDQRS